MIDDRPIHPVILSGGSGTRLWPVSRKEYPKQLLALLGDHTVLQNTIARFSDPALFTAPIVVANGHHRFLIAEQLRAAGAEPQAIILEEVARNTGPAAAVAALYAVRQDPDAVLLLSPADHVVSNVAALRHAVSQAAEAARLGHLVTFGVVPSRAETGYGYIRQGSRLDDCRDVHAVAAFTEKPDKETAQAYLSSGEYLWNSGMVVTKASVLLAEFEKWEPEIVAAADMAVRSAEKDLDFIRLGTGAMEACPSISIDYSVLERTAKAAVVPVDAGWSDIGSWQTLWEIDDKDDRENVCRGPVHLEESSGCYIRSDDNRLLAGIGLEDLVVVATKDATLVAPRARAGEIGRVVEHLRAEGRPEADVPPIVSRPWGMYEDLVDGAQFRVKRIVVKPGGRLSLQYHHHRSEHWVVVSGTAHVTRDTESAVLKANESIYIPIGASHRLENRSDEPLVLIEVQCGDYLGEDDIVRLEDVYGRVHEAAK
jgi:mannose-1-phosphate guanylyltransferase/mannose-6-phosphate isomerase